MRNILSGLALAALCTAALPSAAVAQEPASITGRVTNAQGRAEAGVTIWIATLGVGTTTGADGSYRMVVPGARLRGGAAYQIVASRTGLLAVARSIQLRPGAILTQNFQIGTGDRSFDQVVGD